eukprot:SAG31_NODE_8264_length_1486_cov_1.148522_1_plen_81_part_00
MLMYLNLGSGTSALYLDSEDLNLVVRKHRFHTDLSGFRARGLAVLVSQHASAGRRSTDFAAMHQLDASSGWGEGRTHRRP